MIATRIFPAVGLTAFLSCVFASPARPDFFNNHTALTVIGQTDMTANTPNQGPWAPIFSPAANTLYRPGGVMVSNGKLFVADYNNHRVLIYNEVPQAGQNDAPADIVIGQADMVSGDPNRNRFDEFNCHANSLYWPDDAIVFNSTILVSDSNNNRTLIFEGIPSVNDPEADLVIGQRELEGPPYRVPNQGLQVGPQTQNIPRRVFPYEHEGQEIVFICDTENHRVLIYHGIPEVNNADADVVIGQWNMMTNQPNQSRESPGPNTLKSPKGIFVAEGKVFISDTGNHRILVYDQIPTENGVDADLVLGQANFFTGLPNRGLPVAGANTLNEPIGSVFYDGEKLYVCDTWNHRVLIFDSLPNENGATAQVVIGQQSMEQNWINQAVPGPVPHPTPPPTANTLYAPDAVYRHQNELLIADTYNNRVLIYSAAGPTPVPTMTPTPTPEGYKTPVPTQTPSATPTLTPSPIPSATPMTTATPSPSPTVTPSPSATASPTSTPSATPTLTPSPSATPTTTPLPSATPAYCAEPLQISSLEDLRISRPRSSLPDGWSYQVAKAAPLPEVYGEISDNANNFISQSNYPVYPVALRIKRVEEDIDIQEGDYLEVIFDGENTILVYPPPLSGDLDVYYFIGIDGSTYNDLELCEPAKLVPTPSLAPTKTPSATPSPSPTVSPTPSAAPTQTPSATPTQAPSATPTATVTPLASPTPSAAPTPSPLPDPFSRWSLPAGATMIDGVSFDTFVLLSNPGATEAPVEVAFATHNGPIAWTGQTISPNSRSTIKVNDYVAGDLPAVSTIVRSLNNVPIMCERAMYWGGVPGNWEGGHNTIGIDRPGNVWNLPEGATHLFDMYVHVLNPGASWVTATAVFMNQEGATWEAEADIPPQANWTIDVWNEVGSQPQISTQVIASGPVAVDRTMYLKDGAGGWVGGHCSRGLAEPATEWFLAEGANHIFDHYVLASNPSAGDSAEVLFTFMDQDGNSTTHTHTLGPQSRYTVNVNNIPGWGDRSQVSTMVKSLNGADIFVERAMYWPRGGPNAWADGHDSIGAAADALARKWYLPEGATHLFNQYVLVANPSDQTAGVNFTFMGAAGVIDEYEVNIPPGRRYTVNVNNRVGSQGQVSTVVESDIPVVAERAMYWPIGSPAGWRGGHGTVGIAEGP